MKGLWLKDLYNLKAYMRQYLILMVFFMIFGVSMGNPHYIMWMSLVLGLNIGFSAFSFDESGGYVYMLAAPISRRRMVQARYLADLAAAALMVLCSGVGEMISWMVNGKATEFWLVEMACVLGVYFIFTGILTAVAYRFGVEKARVTVLGLVALPMVLVFLSMKLIQISAIANTLGRFAQAFTQEWTIYCGPLLFLGVGLVAFGGSYLLSARVFERKEL